MNIPTSPVHTLPLSSTTTASMQREQRPAITVARANTRLVVPPDPDVEERQRVEAQHQQTCDGDRGEHRIHRGPAVLGPVHVLQMQDQRELVEHQRGTDTEERCRHREFGYSPADCQGHHRHPGQHDQDDADHDVVDVHAAVPDVPRLPPLRRRVAVGVSTDVAHDGARHEERQDERDQTTQQRQPLGGMKSSWMFRCTDENLRRPARVAIGNTPTRRGAPIGWSPT